MQIFARKDKNWELYWWRFIKIGSDSDSYDETESDIDNDKDDEELVESVLITLKA